MSKHTVYLKVSPVLLKNFQSGNKKNGNKKNFVKVIYLNFIKAFDKDPF